MGWALGYFYGNLGWDWGYFYGNFTSANKGLLCGYDSIGYRASLGYGACGIPQRPCNQALVMEHVVFHSVPVTSLGYGL